MAARKWPSCNVFHAGSDRFRVWRFDLKGRRYVARGTDSFPAGQPLPAGQTGVGWQSLVQPRLNVAWLPADQVFLRVIQLPQCVPEELAPMVELQLEKISPLPTNQVVWEVQGLGEAEAGMQTVLVAIAELDAVERFLGSLEEARLFVNRLDVSAVDHLIALKPQSDGAWIFPELTGVPTKALVAWWFGGVLRSLGLVELPPEGDRGAALHDQLMQMAWAGEIDGWLASAPRWHLVAAAEAQDPWLSVLKDGLQGEIEVTPSVDSGDLALSCANRALQAGGRVRGLLPEAYATRYRQQLTDRLWMRGLGALVVVYLAGLLVYFALLGFESWRLAGVQKEVRQLGPAYTNALELKATFDVLNDLHELKYAALDCWKLTSEMIPSGVQLDGLNFSDGVKLTLSGTAPEDSVAELIDFSANLRNVKVNGKPMFHSEEGEQLSYKKDPRSPQVNWNFTLVLKRSEVR